MKKIVLIAFFLIGVIVNAQIPSYVPSNGLVGWWPFNGNANDESGNGNNGVVIGASLTNDRNGNSNGAFYFENNKIEIPHNYNLGIQQFQGLSISLWAKKNTGSINTHLMGKRPSGSQNFNWHIADWDGLQFSSTSAPNVFGAITNQPVDTSNWMSVIGVYSNETWSLYLNGNLVVTNSINYFFPDVNTPLVFGNSGDWGGFYGKLDDIGIWNRALTPCEIQDLYNSQLHFTMIDAGLDQIVCKGDNVILVATGGSSYQWNNNVQDGQVFVANTTQTFVVNGMDSFGCFGIDSMLLTVNLPSSVSQTQTALDSYIWPVNNQTYTQSGIYTDTLVNLAGCDSVITLNLSLEFTGIDEQNVMTVIVSPNPITNSFSISGIEQIVSLTLKDLNGKWIKSFDIQDENYSMSNVTSGVYFLEVRDEKRSYIVKVIKE